MPQVIVNPRDLRAFAQQLAEEVGQLKARERQLDASLQILGSTWADEKYRRFSKAYTTTSVQFQAFYRVSEKYVAFLGAKATAAERYLGR